jgi:hypothetical protein
MACCLRATIALRSVCFGLVCSSRHVARARRRTETPQQRAERLQRAQQLQARAVALQLQAAVVSPSLAGAAVAADAAAAMAAALPETETVRWQRLVASKLDDDDAVMSPVGVLPELPTAAYAAAVERYRAEAAGGVVGALGAVTRLFAPPPPLVSAALAGVQAAAVEAKAAIRAAKVKADEAAAAAEKQEGEERRRSSRSARSKEATTVEATELVAATSPAAAEVEMEAGGG